MVVMVVMTGIGRIRRKRIFPRVTMIVVGRMVILSIAVVFIHGRVCASILIGMN